MTGSLTQRLTLAAATLLLGATSASAAVVTRTFAINAATIVDLYSATFDGALSPCGGSPTQECTFFGGTPPAGRDITVTNIGTGDGSLNVNYEDTTGEILQVNSMKIRVPDITIVIADPGGPTTTTTIQGTAANDVPFIESGYGTIARDLNGPLVAAVVLGRGTADADQAPALGQASVFQHNDAPNPDAPDFAVFSQIVDSCGGPFCVLITLDTLTLDGVRYRLEGTISGAGGDSLVLKVGTGNNSIYQVALSTALEPVDIDGDLVTNALDNCPITSNVAQTNSDADARGDACDNCILNSNVTQLDANGDGFGNLCDADINNSGTVTTADFGLLRSVLGQAISFSATAAASDMNGSGTVTTADFGLLRARLGTAVAGQSGLACAGTVPCPAP